MQYFIDEAAFGQTPATLQDAAPNPLDLQIDFPTSTTPVFDEEADGTRFLRFSGPELSDTGGARANGASTKLEAHHGRTRATLEVMYAVDDCAPTGQRIFGMGRGNGPGAAWLTIRQWGGDFGLVVTVSRDTPSGDLLTYAASSPCEQTRTRVVHWVVDTGASTSNDRVRLYVDGIRDPDIVPAPDNVRAFPQQGATITLSRGVERLQAYLGGPHLSEGEQTARTAQMRIYYAATYLDTLSEPEIATHAAALRGL